VKEHHFLEKSEKGYGQKEKSLTETLLYKPRGDWPTGPDFEGSQGKRDRTKKAFV